MRELNVKEIEQVDGGIWTPTTSHHDDPTSSSERERLAELLMFLGSLI